MTARSTSRSRASCCCPCGLAPVVTVAAGTSWGDAIPCYASHHMMLVLLYGLAHNTYPTLKPRQFFYTKTKIRQTSTQTHRQSFFFVLDVEIRNSLRSNNTFHGCLISFPCSVSHHEGRGTVGDVTWRVVATRGAFVGKCNVVANNVERR